MVFSFVHGTEGDRATSLSSASRNGSIDASRLSPKSINGMLLHAARRRSWALCTRKKNYLLALFTFVHGAEGDRATSASSVLHICRQRGFLGHPLRISNFFKYWAYTARAFAQ